VKRSPMRRTGWDRKPVDSHLNAKRQEENQPLALMHPAPVAIKAIAKCRAVMAKMGDVVDVACPKAPKPWRNRAYRELVASLECYHCRLHGHSQAAHPNTGKAKGVKACDSLIFPMCCVSGNDHHRQFDQYELVPRADMQAYEEAAHRWTVATLQARGMWPKTNQPLAPAIIA
jgi:hypothetical protein